MIRRQLLSNIPQLFGLSLFGLRAAGGQEATPLFPGWLASPKRNA
jgi:hypothetical protein